MKIHITPPESVPYDRFEIEMNAKNQAYDFILSRGHYNEWVEFCKSYKSENTREQRVDKFLQMIQNKEI